MTGLVNCIYKHGYLIMNYRPGIWLFATTYAMAHLPIPRSQCWRSVAIVMDAPSYSVIWSMWCSYKSYYLVMELLKDVKILHHVIQA